MSYVISVLGILVTVMWLCLALPTPQDRERFLDSTGKTTGVNWR